MTGDEVGRQAVELLRARDGESAPALADVPQVLGHEHRQLVAQPFETRARGLGTIDAEPAQIAQRALDVVARFRRRRRRGEGPVARGTRRDAARSRPRARRPSVRARSPALRIASSGCTAAINPARPLGRADLARAARRYGSSVLATVREPLTDSRSFSSCCARASRASTILVREAGSDAPAVNDESTASACARAAARPERAQRVDGLRRGRSGQHESRDGCSKGRSSGPDEPEHEPRSENREA